MTKALQWGGRFAQEPDAALLAFGSSLEEDMVLAPYDVACSLAHVEALSSGGVVDARIAGALRGALAQVQAEIESGDFARWARSHGGEDVHGAIDARVRALCEGGEGEFLHAGRSRNDQVATTLLLYARARGEEGHTLARGLAERFVACAREELEAGTLLCATTHGQPAQPALLSFWLCAAAEPFVRATRRFACTAADAKRFCPLGSAAVAGSSLALERAAAASALEFEAPSRNAMDAIGNRDAVLDVAHAFVRATVDASRIAGELVTWCTPAFGYVRLSDAVSTGSSLMPQKRNPDPFELVRGIAAELTGSYAGALATLCGLPLSYHRDLQQTKRLSIAIIERGGAALRAFVRAFDGVTFERDHLNAHAADGYSVATDIADALIATGVSARRAHERVGNAVARAEREERALSAADLAELGVTAPLAAMQSVQGKRTTGSTNPHEVVKTIAAVEQELRSG